MTRVVQVAGGTLFGSKAFVERWIFGFGNKFTAATAVPHAVGDVGFSSHGWRIAKKAEKALMKSA